MPKKSMTFVRYSVVLVSLIATVLFVPASAQAATYVGPGGTTGATMKFQPTSVTAVHGTTVKLRVVVDTKGRAVNSVQIVLAFSDARLDCAAVTPGTAWSFVAAKECTSSTAKIAIGTPVGSPAFTGTATAATISLRTTSLTGLASVNFAPDGAVGGGCLVVAVGGVDVLGPTNRAVITIT